MRAFQLLFLLFISAPLFSQPISLTYTEPAIDWTEALPVGNGSLGGMWYGGMGVDRIALNESSLVDGNEKEMGSYKPFGELVIVQEVQDSSGYYRRLDIGKAVCESEFGMKGNIQKRFVFSSYPDKVIVYRIEGGMKKGISADIILSPSLGEKVTGNEKELMFQGSFPTGLNYTMVVRIMPEGMGTSEYSDGRLKVKGYRNITILISAATSYIPDAGCHFLGENPDSLVNNRLANATRLGYRKLLSRHVRDYKSLYDSFSLSLGEDPCPGSDMKTRLARYRDGEDDPALEALLCQYGRYLLISSSREGGLPANLQGIWNDKIAPPWRCQYTTNINLQMNYWVSELTGLGTCQMPLFKYLDNISEVLRHTDDPALSTTNGWMAYTTMNFMGGSTRWAIHGPGPAWLVKHYWDHYAFSGDVEFLRDRAYPMLKDLVLYWKDTLVETEDGTILVPNGWSPEHGPGRKEGDRMTYPGVSYDQQIVYDLFSNYIDASNVLAVDFDLKELAEDMRKRMLKPMVGRWGQLQEWMEDWDDPQDKHRHISHLFAVYPGRQISVHATPELAQAALISLRSRGMQGTGWSTAWKMNLYARLLQPESVHQLVRSLLTDRVQANLFTLHPPFQIDANLGYSAGVVECLLQSHEDAIDILPSLCPEWEHGFVNGAHARGGFIVDMKWDHGELTFLKVHSTLGGRCRLRIHKDNGEQIKEFMTYPGGNYSLRKHI